MREYTTVECDPDERWALLERKFAHASNGGSDSTAYYYNGGRERDHENQVRLSILLKLAIFLLVIGLGICSFIVTGGAPGWYEVDGGLLKNSSDRDIFPCNDNTGSADPCFIPSDTRVSTTNPGFPSFWNYAHRGPLRVSYDERALKINDERAFFLGGSLHPARATKMTWNRALDEAVHNGLNLITVYVMWSAHQPLPHIDLDWGFPGSHSFECDSNKDSDSSSSSSPSKSSSKSYLDDDCEWNLATAIRSAAERGLFVHLRLGPYDCAEYNYGGIPEWLPLHKPHMEMRRPNREWMEVMEGFITQLVEYISKHQLWAHQGGNIIMAQIENELGDDDTMEKDQNLLWIDEVGNFVEPNRKARGVGRLRKATLQDYADWCGALAHKLEPNVTWTMCNGLYANNIILTCNAINDGHLWLEKNGGNGRIQVDQPAIFTEFEGGFQTWGSEAEQPLDYFWGRTARAMARDAMKWFARGGCHLNYYMFWGSYNRQRMAGAGITNMYASDVALCPSGQPRQPKFDHFQVLHHVIQAIAPTLLLAPTSLGKGQPLLALADDGSWKQGSDQRLFRYEIHRESHPSILFLENDALAETVVKVLLKEGDINPLIVRMNAESSIVMVDGIIKFDSSSIEPSAMKMERKFADSDSLPLLLNWETFAEPIGMDSRDSIAWSLDAPVEQTELNIDSGVSSDYAWYETWFDLDDSSEDTRLHIETQRANAMMIYIDGEFVAASDDHLHKEGPIWLHFGLGELENGEHKLCILSESLGYHNLIGRWGGGVNKKTKGITGSVILELESKNKSLVDGRTWRSYPGLHGESKTHEGISRHNLSKRLKKGGTTGPMWSSFQFDTPRYDSSYQALFLKITSGRGHFWLNGNDMGKFWNITRGYTEKQSQDRYFLPNDFLRNDRKMNELILFNAFGESRKFVTLEISWTKPSDIPNFEDTVDYEGSCI